MVVKQLRRIMSLNPQFFSSPFSTLCLLFHVSPRQLKDRSFNELKVPKCVIKMGVYYYPLFTYGILKHW